MEEKIRTNVDPMMISKGFRLPPIALALAATFDYYTCFFSKSHHTIYLGIFYQLQRKTHVNHSSSNISPSIVSIRK